MPLTFDFIFRTSPEEFLGRLADLEKEKKGSDGHSDERGRGFSLPSKPKAAPKTESSMKKEKVRKERAYFDLKVTRPME